MMSRLRPTSSRRFTRSWLWEQTRTFLWVALVSGLIWVYADMEFTETKEFTVTVHFVSAPNSKLVLSSPNDQEIIFRARGNRGSLEAFENLSKSRGSRIELDLARFQPGANDVSAEELLLRDSGFAKSGLTVVSGTPSRVQFQLDRMLTIKDVPVELDYTGAILAHPAVVRPATMDIQVPESKWRLILQQRPTPVLRTATVNLAKVPTDRPLTLEVVPAIEGVPVIAARQTVSVEVQVTRLTEQMSLTVNVRVNTPTGWLDPADNTWKEYQLLRKDPLEWRKQIMVTGPKQDLEALKARELEVVAFVTLTDDDKKPTAWTVRNVTVCFPPDLQVHLAPIETPTVQFKLVPIH